MVRHHKLWSHMDLHANWRQKLYQRRSKGAIYTLTDSQFIWYEIYIKWLCRSCSILQQYNRGKWSTKKIRVKTKCKSKDQSDDQWNDQIDAQSEVQSNDQSNDRRIKSAMELILEFIDVGNDECVTMEYNVWYRFTTTDTMASFLRWIYCSE